MRILLQGDPIIQKVEEKHPSFAQDDELQEAYEARMKWKRDYNTLIAAAKREGREEGYKEGYELGLQQGYKERYKSMLLKVIEVLFGSVSEETSQKLDKIEDSGTMENLFKNLMRSKSLEDFDAKLSRFLEG